MMYLVVGSMEEGLLGEEFFGMITNVIFFLGLNYFSADLCVSEGVRNILCKVSLPLSSFSLHSLLSLTIRRGLNLNGFLLSFQESTDKIPDAFQTHVLLQTCGKTIVQRLDKQ